MAALGRILSDGHVREPGEAAWCVYIDPDDSIAENLMSEELVCNSFAHWMEWRLRRDS